VSLGRDLLVAALRPRPPKGPLSRQELDLVHHLLVVRAHDQLGDFLLATPALHALRRRFPRAHLTLVVNEFLAPLALGQPDVDRVVVAPWTRSPRNPWQIARLLRDLSSRRYDLALVLNTVSHSLTSDVVARLSGAERVAGPTTPALKDLPGAPLYDWAFEPGPPVGSHQLARSAAVVAPLGCDRRPSGYRFALDPKAQDVADRVQESLPAGRLVALHIGTRDPEKRYPTELWAEAANRIGDESDAHLVLLDAPDVRPEVRFLAGGLRVPHTMLGPLSLRETAAVISRMQLLLCHDSALLHAAAAVGTPTVSVHGRGEVAEWAPPGDAHRALQAASRRPADVPPDLVAAEARTLLRIPLARTN
jgi:ADP-heptose:LPS heptosyltransferase